MDTTTNKMHLNTHITQVILKLFKIIYYLRVSSFIFFLLCVRPTKIICVFLVDFNMISYQFSWSEEYVEGYHNI